MANHLQHDVEAFLTVSQPNKPSPLMIFTGVALVALSTLAVRLFQQRQMSQASNRELDTSLEETFPASDSVAKY